MAEDTQMPELVYVDGRAMYGDREEITRRYLLFLEAAKAGEPLKAGYPAEQLESVSSSDDYRQRLEILSR